MARKAKEEKKPQGYLVATRPILYEGRQFEAGDKLPAYDEKMVEAWEESKSAVRVEPEQEKKEKTKKEPEGDAEEAAEEKE